MAPNNKSSRLQIETLEDRLALSTVQAFIDGSGDLMVQGDDSNNALYISETWNGNVRISGYGYGTTINGTNAVEFPKTFSDLVIELEGGNDDVSVSYVDLPRDLDIQLGAGYDQVSVTGVTTGDDLFIDATGDTYESDWVLVSNSVIGSSSNHDNDLIITGDSQYEYASVTNVQADDDIILNLATSDFESDYAWVSSLRAKGERGSGELHVFARTIKGQNLDILGPRDGDVKFRRFQTLNVDGIETEDIWITGRDLSSEGDTVTLKNATPTDQFQIKMYAGDDKVTLEQSSGATLVDGGDGNDTLLGSDGPDSLVGGNGDDFLSGGNHNDTLVGGTGNDGLWGGPAIDTINDGGGLDRFYDRGQDAGDLGGVSPGFDVAIKLKDGMATSDWFHGTWDNEKLLPVDASLLLLQQRTGNNALVQGANGETLEFTIYGESRGDERAAGWNAGSGKMALTAVAYDPIYGDDWTMQVVLHEVGHNWDELSENGYIGMFQAMSGWATMPSGSGDWVVANRYGETWFWNADLDSATFVREYGKVHPVEDWATHFAYYMMAYAGLDYNSGSIEEADIDKDRPDGAMNDKFDILDMFFASLS